jgi:hypothetical protein
MAANKLSFDEKPCRVRPRTGTAGCNVAATSAATSAYWAVLGAYANTALHFDEHLQLAVRENLYKKWLMKATDEPQ